MSKRSRSLRGDESKKALQIIDLSSSRRYNTRSSKRLIEAGDAFASSHVGVTNGSAKKKLAFDDEEDVQNVTTTPKFRISLRKGKKHQFLGASEEVETESVQSPIRKRKQVKTKESNVVSSKDAKKKVWNTRLKDKLEVKGRPKRATRRRLIVFSDEDRCESSGDVVESESETEESEGENWPLITSRSSPKQLLRAIEHLTPGQKRKVRSMGFGKLLSLRMTEIPQKLGHYVVDCFDDDKLELIVGDRVVKVDENSIHGLLGVPDAGLELDGVNPTQNLFPRLAAWRALYAGPDIPRSMIADRITNSRDDNFEFMIDFLVLFLSTFVECNSQGRCKYEVLYCFTESTDISKINWSRYICNRMQGCKKGWLPNTKTVFRGALPILTLLYVDNFKVDGMETDREMAPISYWTIDLLKQRQLHEISNGGFGFGTFVGPSNATCWPGDEDNPVFSRHLIENRTDEDLVELLKGMLEKAKETKQFIANNLGALVNTDRPLGVAIDASMLFAEVYGHHPLAIEDTNRNATANKNQPSGSSGTGVTKNSRGCGSGIEKGSYSDGTHVNTAVETHISGDEGANVQRDDIVGRGDQLTNTEETISLDVNVGIPHTEALGEVSRHRSDEEGDSAEEAFPRFGTQQTNIKNIADPIEEKRKDKGPKEPRKPTTDPMFDLDISVPLAAAAIDCLRKGNGEDVETNNDPFMKACLQINKNRLEWFDTESDDSDNDGANDETQEQQSEQAGDDSEDDADNETDTVVGTDLGSSKFEAIKYKRRSGWSKCVTRSGIHRGLTIENLLLRVKEAKACSAEPSISVDLNKRNNETDLPAVENDGKDQANTVSKSSFDAPSFSIGLTQMEEASQGAGEGLPKGDNKKRTSDGTNTCPQVEEDKNVEGNESISKGVGVEGCFGILDLEGPSFSLGLTQTQEAVDVLEYDSDEHETLADRLKRKFRGKQLVNANQEKGLGLNLTTECTTKGNKVSILNRYTVEEREVWNLIMKNEKRGLVLFDNNQIYISDVKVFRSLLPGNELDGQLIDCMTCVLNDEEARRGPTKPRRLFCSRDVLLHWMLSSVSNDEDSRLRSFSKGIFQALGRNAEKRSLKDYDLVFIPVLEHRHYYLLVFDLMKPRIYLLDNICESKTLVQLYDHADYFDKSTAYKVKHLFVAYLRSVGHQKIKLVEKCSVLRPNLPWSTQTNAVDCGIFAIRHMELFNGSWEKTFQCGFSADENSQRRQILALRKKYAARILLSPVNDNRELVLCEAGLHDLV